MKKNFTKKSTNLLFVFSLILFLFACSDGKYRYKNTIGTEQKTFTFDNKLNIPKKLLDSIISKSILDSQYKLKNTSTFRLSDLTINSRLVKDTSFLTIDGIKNIKNLECLNILVFFYGKNSFGVESIEWSHYNFYISEGKLILFNPLTVHLEIEEKTIDKPESYEKAHTIDSTITISWGNRDYTYIGNNARIYGNKERNLSISKNNIEKALEILKTKQGNFKLEKKLLDDKSFGINCGVDDYIYGSYSFKDSYFDVKSESKEELIKRLKFILEFVFSPKLKHSKWEVTKTENGMTETYNK